MQSGLRMIVTGQNEIEKNRSFRVFITHCNEEVIPHFNGPSVVTQCKNETNVCNEAIPMLDAMINWYDKITEKNMIFVHSHKFSWHHFDIEEDVKRITGSYYFATSDYGGFPYGLWKRGCDTPVVTEIYNAAFDGVNMPRVWDRVGQYPCCSTFFVKTSLLRKRPKAEYIKIKENLIKWGRLNPEEKKNCGYLMEYTWHLIFTGRKFIDPPHEYFIRYFSFNNDTYCKFNQYNM